MKTLSIVKNNPEKDEKNLKKNTKLIVKNNKEKNKENNLKKNKTKSKEKRGKSTDDINKGKNMKINSKIIVKNKVILNDISNNSKKSLKSKSLKERNAKINFKNNININFGKIPSSYVTYEPRLFNDKIMKKWEEINQKDWYILSPKSRAIANEEMKKLNKEKI